MSYILDALKKAEHERDLGRVPRLESVQDGVSPRRRGAVWVITGALLINAMVLAWWLRPTSPPELVSSIRRPAPVPSSAAPPHSVVPAPVVVTAPSAIITTPATVPAAESKPAPAPAPPLLRDLPAEFRAVVPPLSLDVHVYAPTVSGRFVLINMKKYREGDLLAEGPTIEEITTDGVVLSYQGERFRIARP